MAASYSTIGPYTQGVWLVAAPDGTGAVLPKSLLPPQGTGYSYYWLGTSASEAETRIWDAISKLGVKTTLTNQNLATPVQQALAGSAGPLEKPLTGLANILHQIGEGVVIPPLGNVSDALIASDAAVGGTAATEAGAAGAGAGAAGSGALNAAATGASAVAAATVLSGVWQWLTTPANWLRILKYVAGAVLIFFALKELTGVNIPTPKVVPV